MRTYEEQNIGHCRIHNTTFDMADARTCLLNRARIRVRQLKDELGRAENSIEVLMKMQEGKG